MAGKLKLILLDEDMLRFSGKDGVYFLDVHGLPVHEARMLIKNVGALMSSKDNLTVIHGYNHGTAIKEMLAKDGLFRRTYTLTENAYNKGRTSIQFAA